MLITIDTFRQKTRYELDALVDDLVRETHRSTPAERTAWRASLPAFADVVSHPSLNGFHVHVGQHGGVMVEYRLPASPSWADLVLLGRGPRGPSAVVVELKDWDISRDSPGHRAAIVHRHHGETLHPSDQVQGYVEYCRRFHSSVQELGATVDGCVFFTYASSANAYIADPHKQLAQAFPVFARNATDVQDRFPKYLTERLLTPDPEFAKAFEHGTYKQDRGFVINISRAIQRSKERPFVLLDAQRRGYELCMACVERRLKPAHTSAKTAASRKTGKSIVVIEGPPGSGKSVIAAQLWASLSADERIDGNVVLTTTSAAQRTNWEQLFTNSVGDRSARGVVIGSTQYNPGFNHPWIKRERKSGHPTTVAGWRLNVRRYVAAHTRLRCPSGSFAVSIVDEAHALIDPTAEGRAGMSASGWMLHAGPQAWHVIRASRVAVFLMDPEQSYRDNETTTIDQLQAYAEEFGADFTRISLAGSQFRCSGSSEYIDWVDSTLSVVKKPKVTGTPVRSAPWRKSDGGPYVFEVCDTPFDLESALRAHQRSGLSVRLLSSYARRWKTKKSPRPHSLVPANQDFCIEVTRGNTTRTWSRVWNYTPRLDYSIFIQAPVGSHIATDQLCEVGCPYVVRGFDFDYIGLLWMSDLVWRDRRWRVNLDHVHESAWRLPVSGAKKHRKGAEEEVIRRLQRGYRILLSRAMHGTYVWFEDDETREHVSQLLKPAT